MSHAQKVVIHNKSGALKSLGPLVEPFIADGVRFVAVAAVDCALIEDIIDEIVVGEQPGVEAAYGAGRISHLVRRLLDV